jgi:hypothetical protein
VPSLALQKKKNNFLGINTFNLFNYTIINWVSLQNKLLTRFSHSELSVSELCFFLRKWTSLG